MKMQKGFRRNHWLLLTLPLSGCGVLASNGVDYSSYPIPSLPAPVVIAAPPPPAALPPCAMPQPGEKLSLAGCQLGDVLVLRGVNFEFDQAVLTVNARTLLDDVVAALKQRDDIKVEIDGHTDGKGSDAYNLKLSDERAASVKSYLVAGGIDAARLATQGYGKSVPVADNATDEGREKNRRVELKVTGSAPPPAPPAPVAAPAPAIDHSAVVVLEPIPSFLQEPGAGLPTSIGVLTTVPRPRESGPDEVTSKRALPANYSGSQPALKGYPGSSYAPASSAPPPAAGAPTLSPAPAAAAPSPSPQEAPAAGGSVIISNFMFAPMDLAVTAGSTVTWTNRDSVIHTVRFSDGDRKLASGASYSRSFAQAGTYEYRCSIHPSMVGKITVQ